MKPRSASQIFVIALCVAAFFAAQTFGRNAAFYCLCGGKPVQTKAAYCYGPHGGQCAEKEAQGGAAQNHGEKGDDRKDHQAINQDVPSRPVEAAPQIIPPQVLLAILPMVDIIFASQETKLPASYSVDFGESPPFGVTVARTIVLRI